MTSKHYESSFSPAQLTTAMYFSAFLVPVALVVSVLAAPTELVPRLSCSAYQLVFLAGTSESGLGSVGTPLSTALSAAGFTSYGVPYDTSVEYIVTVAAGATMTKDYITSQAAACPSQRFVLGGYSKGALVVHAISLSSALKSKIASILVFGDPALKLGGSSAWPINSPSVDTKPLDGSTSSQDIASFCNSGDIFCDPSGLSVAAHLAYPTDGSVGVAATFAKSKA